MNKKQREKNDLLRTKQSTMYISIILVIVAIILGGLLLTVTGWFWGIITLMLVASSGAYAVKCVIEYAIEVGRQEK